VAFFDLRNKKKLGRLINSSINTVQAIYRTNNEWKAASFGYTSRTGIDMIPTSPDMRF
jgi:hypothetical protein